MARRHIGRSGLKLSQPIFLVQKISLTGSAKHLILIFVKEAERAIVVARFRDGRIIKGFTQNFFSTKGLFHVFPVDDPSGEGRRISVRDLKAVFFVRDLTGDPGYNEEKKFDEEKKPRGHRVEVTFVDGEVLVGSTLGYSMKYDANRLGFFLTPADPKSNNMKVFAVTDSVEKIRRL
jgi:hypothetical protein